MVVTIREYYTHFIITNLDLVWMSILVQVFDYYMFESIHLMKDILG